MLSPEAPAYGKDMLADGLPFAFSGLMFFNYLFPFVFFFGAGLIYMVLLVMFQDSIDYNEYQFDERKESVISAWRPLDVKLGSALLRGFQYLIFLTAGVMVTVNGISTAEGSLNADMAAAGSDKAAQEAATSKFTTAISELMEGVKPSSLIIIGVWVLVILLACFLAVFFLIRIGYKITEQDHINMVAELEKRHAETGFNSEELETPSEEKVEQPAE